MHAWWLIAASEDRITPCAASNLHGDIGIQVGLHPIQQRSARGG